MLTTARYDQLWGCADGLVCRSFRGQGHRYEGASGNLHDDRLHAFVLLAGWRAAGTGNAGGGSDWDGASGSLAGD